MEALVPSLRAGEADCQQHHNHPSWALCDADFEDDSPSATDLRDLLLSIEGECRALRSSSSFRVAAAADGIEIVATEPGEVAGDRSKVCAASEGEGHAVFEAAAGGNGGRDSDLGQNIRVGRSRSYPSSPNLATMLDEIEGNCRSFRFAARPPPPTLVSDGSSGDSSEDGRNHDSPRHGWAAHLGRGRAGPLGPEDDTSSGDDEDGGARRCDDVGSLLAVRCALLSPARRRGEREEGARRRRRRIEARQRRAKKERVMQIKESTMMGRRNVDDIIHLVPEDLRPKLRCPFEV